MASRWSGTCLPGTSGTRGTGSTLPLKYARLALGTCVACLTAEIAQGSETPEMPAYFRFLTLMSFNVFIREEVRTGTIAGRVVLLLKLTTMLINGPLNPIHVQVDVALVEVGVGGRTDATNVVHPDACGISSLGYDHQKVLGDTLTEIAYEKAGIFKVRSRRLLHTHRTYQTLTISLSLTRQRPDWSACIHCAPDRRSDVKSRQTGRNQEGLLLVRQLSALATPHHHTRLTNVFCVGR